VHSELFGDRVVELSDAGDGGIVRGLPPLATLATDSPVFGAAFFGFRSWDSFPAVSNAKRDDGNQHVAHLFAREADARSRP
jgi:hypothetical protein